MQDVLKSLGDMDDLDANLFGMKKFAGVGGGSGAVSAGGKGVVGMGQGIQSDDGGRKEGSGG